MRRLASRSSTTLFVGVYWSYIAFALPRLITFVSTLALARLLGPQEFGLFAITLLIIRYLDTIHDVGIGPALIQSPDRSERLVRNALTVSLAIAMPISTSLFFAAPQLASF